MNKKYRALIPILISLSLFFSLFFFLPFIHVSWMISPAEEYHGWQFVAIDGSVSFWLFGYGLNHRYVYFMSTNGSEFPCEDWGWFFTPYPYH